MRLPRVLDVTAGSWNTGQPHLIAQSLSRILPTLGEPSVDLQVRTDGGLGTLPDFQQVWKREGVSVLRVMGGEGGVM